MARRGVHGAMKSDVAIDHMEKYMNRKDKEMYIPLTLKEQFAEINRIKNFAECWPRKKWFEELERKCHEIGVPEKSFYEFREENEKLFENWYSEEKLPNEQLARIIKSKY